MAGMDKFALALQSGVVFDWMQANGLRTLEVPFSGSGDSGAFDDCVNPGKMLNKSKPSWIDINRQLVQDRAADLSMRELILKLSMQIEDETPHDVDWWNNEGGEGYVEWVLSGMGSDGIEYIRGVHLYVAYREVSLNSSSYSIIGRDDPANDYE